MDFRPFTRVTINGVPLTGFLFSQLTSVRVTDTAGFVSDTAEITFANVSALKRFSLPEPGAEVKIELGYLFGFRDMGIFIADEIEESGPPRQITATCRAKVQGEISNGMAPIHQHKTRSWPAGLTLKTIASKMASDNGLKPAITEAAAAIVPGHIDQIDESDIAVLTRIAYTHDLIAKPAGGRLFLGRHADAITASGRPMPKTSLSQSSVSRWQMRRSLGEAVGTVIATYRDIEHGTDVEVKVGDREPTRRLPQRFRTQEEAQSAADAEARRADRAVETLDISMPGNPSIVAESKIELLDFSAAASGEWVVETAIHELSEAGYSTSIKATRPE